MIASLCILILACIYIYFFPFIPKRKKHYTYALLLGCPAHDDGTMSSSQIKRCDLAIKAYQQNLYDTLIISGSNVKNEFIEAKVMHAYIQNKMDIPTILETNARNTFENFKFSKDIIQKKRCIDFNITNSRQKSLCHCQTILFRLWLYVV